MDIIIEATLWNGLCNAYKLPSQVALLIKDNNVVIMSIINVNEFTDSFDYIRV
ncbi:Uncharacterised protein [Klebsiella aerogenes]|nr:Uncharacterised protein [Klebsiella aerogenes]